MPDKLAPSEPDVLRHYTPPRLRLAGLIALGIAILVVIGGLALRFFAARDTKDWTDDQAVPSVQLVKMNAIKVGSEFTLPGDVQPFVNATIFAQVSGYVQKWYVDIGTPVKAGQLLAQIDPKPYEAALDQAKGQLARDAATLANAQVDLSRYRTLAGQNAISQQQLATQQAMAAADAGVTASDKAAVATAAINLNYTRIVAPFDGVVTSRSLDVGQLVTVGTATSTTPLFTVTDQSRLRIYVRIPQSYSGLVHPGMTATFTVPEHPDRVFTATLAASADAIVSQSGTQLVQFQIDNSDHAIKPGDYAEMHFATPHDTGTTQLPVTALLFRDSGMMVATVDKTNHVVMKPIEIATDLGSTVDVGSGISPGDRIIDNPTDSLRAGDLVQISSSASP